MGPDYQPDVNLLEMLAYAALNPATIAVSFLMGRKADALPKIMIAGFSGAIAGAVLIYIATLFRLWDAPELARAVAGIFIAGMIAGMVYGAIGYLTKPKG